MLINIVALEMLGAKMPKPTGEEDDDDDDVNGDDGEEDDDGNSDDGEEDDDDKIIKMLRMATIMSQQSPWIVTNPHKFLMSTTFLGRDCCRSV